MFILLTARPISQTLSHLLGTMTGDRDQWDCSAGKGPAPTDTLSLIPEPTGWWEERTDSRKLSSDFHKHTTACTHTHKQMRKCINKKKKKLSGGSQVTREPSQLQVMCCWLPLAFSFFNHLSSGRHQASGKEMSNDSSSRTLNPHLIWEIMEQREAMSMMSDPDSWPTEYHGVVLSCQVWG